MDASDVNLLPGLAKSYLPGIAWPFIPHRKTAHLLGLIWQYEDSQWWPREKIEQQAFLQLNMLLRHAHQYSPFYKDRLNECGYTPGMTIDRRFFERLPPLTRQDIQGNQDVLRCSKIPKAHGKTKTFKSSGTTGHYVSVLRTELTALFFEATTMRDHFWNKREFNHRVAAIRVVKDPKMGIYPAGSRDRNWGSPVDGLFKTGESWLLRIDTPISEQIDWLMRAKPGYLVSFPNNLYALACHAEAHGITFPALKQIISMSETLQPEVLQTCTRVFKVPVSNTYSCEEIGLMASQCPDHPVFHVHSEHVLLEVVDDDNLPCAPGEQGRVLATDLHNFAMPLIRYELGDYAELGEPCACGRGLPVISRILGRERNLLTLPNGDRLWPVPGFSKFSEVTGRHIRLAQIIQHDLETIEVKLEMEGTLKPGEEQALVDLLRTNLHYAFNVTFTYCDYIERSKSGKLEHFISRVA